MTKEGYQPTKTKKTIKIIPPNTGSHVHMKKDGYTWEDIDRSFWEGFHTAKNNMEKRIADLEKQVKDLKWQLQEVAKDNDLYQKENAELKSDNEARKFAMAMSEKVEKQLRQENEKLKTDYEVLSCSVGNFGELQDTLEEEQRKNNALSDNLTKAKEIIKKFLHALKNEGSEFTWQLESNHPAIQEAEQFLSEVEK